MLGERYLRSAVTYISTNDSPTLARRWFEHYGTIGIKNFYVFFHSSDEPRLDKPYLELFKDFKVRIVQTVYGTVDETERVENINNFKSQELANEHYILTVDVDEFVVINQQTITDMQSTESDFIPALLVDRFALNGRLRRIPLTDSMFSAFPICCLFTKAALDGSQSKRPIAKPNINHGIGLHYVDGEQNYRAFEAYIYVYHFKWYHGLVNRIEKRLRNNFGCKEWSREAKTLLARYIDTQKNRVKIDRFFTWIDYRYR